MLRKIVFVLLALALPVLAATAVGAQQYPPTGDGPSATTVAHDAGDGPAPTAAADAPDGADDGSGGEGSAPLARTGTDLALPAAVGAVLLVGGVVALVSVALTGRRRSAA